MGVVLKKNRDHCLHEDHLTLFTVVFGLIRTSRARVFGPTDLLRVTVSSATQFWRLCCLAADGSPLWRQLGQWLLRRRKRSKM